MLHVFPLGRITTRQSWQSLASSSNRIYLLLYGTQNPLITASKGGKAALVDVLLCERNSDVNAKDVFGRTALTYAVRYGHENVVKHLVAAGAQIYLKDKTKRDARETSVYHKQNAITDLLDHIIAMRRQEKEDAQQYLIHRGKQAATIAELRNISEKAIKHSVSPKITITWHLYFVTFY